MSKEKLLFRSILFGCIFAVIFSFFSSFVYVNAACDHIPDSQGICRFCGVDLKGGSSEGSKPCSHSWSGATCTASATCSKCGATNPNSSLGHNWTTSTVAATCIATGTKTTYCSRCSAVSSTQTLPIDPNNHTNMHWIYTGANDNSGIHKKYCNGCMKVEVDWTNHDYGNSHSCVCGAGYAWGSEHRFSAYGGTCEAYNSSCSVVLSAGVSFDNDLPPIEEYKMIDATTDYPHKTLSTVTVTFNHIPYISENGGKSIGEQIPASAVSFDWYTFDHGNYNQHLGAISHSLINKSETVSTALNYANIIKEAGENAYLETGEYQDTYRVVYNRPAVGSINQKYGDWTGLFGMMQSLLQTGDGNIVSDSASGTEYTMSADSISGHAAVHAVYVNFPNKQEVLGGAHLFCNGACDATAVNIYAHLNVAYRTLNGEHFEGLDDTLIKTSVYCKGSKNGSISVSINHGVPDRAGYRYVGYAINEGSLVPAGASGISERGYITSVDVPMSFSTSGINKSITFYYEPVNVTIRHYNMTDGTTEDNGLRQITTSGNLTKTDTFYRGLKNENEEILPLASPDYSSNSLSKFWWPAYNLEFATVSTNSNPDFDTDYFRRVTFHPYKVFTAKTIVEEELSSIVNKSESIESAIKEVYGIDDSKLVIDIIERKVDNNEYLATAKNNISEGNNILVYARENVIDFIEDKSADNFYNELEVDLMTTKLVTVLEDLLLSDTDKQELIKKTVAVPYAAYNKGVIEEDPANRADKYINYYYTTTEIMVNNIDSDKKDTENPYMQSNKDALGNTHNLRTKVPIRDTIFRAESLITTPPALDSYNYSYSVYNPANNTYSRQEYNISGYVLERFDIKVGEEVLLEITQKDAENWYKIGTSTELYPPFTEQFIIDTSTSEGISAYIASEIAQIDLARLDKDASVNFYYKDVSLLKVKYIRDTDNAEIHPSKSIILSGDVLVSPEEINNYEYYKYNLDGEEGTAIPVTVTELSDGKDRELVFIYKVPKLELETPEKTKRYVDLRSNNRVPADQIQQERYESAPARLTGDGYYSNTYKSAEEYNSYNDAERLANQTNEGIPTSEDIYANVVTEQFLMDNALSTQPTTQKMKLKIVKRYFETNRQDNQTATSGKIEDQIRDIVKIVEKDLDELELPYQYYGASGADLKIIENAFVYNDVILDKGAGTGGLNQTELLPTYDKPYMNYTKNGYLHLPGTSDYDATIDSIPEIDGIKDYRSLKPGFYSVKNPSNRGDTFEAVWVLEGIDEYEPNLDKLKNEYQYANGLILTALQDAGTLVKTDRLTVTYNYSANGKEEGKTKDFLVVTDDFNEDASGKIDKNNNMRLGRTYTADALEKMGVLHIQDIPLTGTDVLYKKSNLFIDPPTTNGTHGVRELSGLNIVDEYKDNTIADVKYVLYQIIKEEQVVGGPAPISLEAALNGEYEARYAEAIRNQTIIGHPVVVHTPVVNASIFDLSNGKKNDYSDANKHTVNDIIGSNGTIVLGERFDLSIPNSGIHIDSVGYGSNEYNYNGLIANGVEGIPEIDNNPEKFAIIKQIRFDKVGVILYTKDISENITGGNYYPKNTWIDLPKEQEKYTFTIPEWEEEIWDDRQIIVETRVAAENILVIDDKDKYVCYNYNDANQTTANSYNKLKSQYGVWKTFGFKIIGELRDLEIRATNDPGFSGYKTEGTASLPLGQLGQGNGGNAYKYGVKLGYSVYFDITSTGWTGDTTESVKLTPKYYYVSKAGGEAVPVDLYYKLVGNPNYVKMEGATGARPLSTVMSIDAVKGSRCKSVFASWINRELGKGSGYFNANAGQEMANTSRLISSLKNEAMANYVKEKNKAIINYAISIKTGNTDLITLPYSVRLAYTNAVNAMLTQKYAGVSSFDIVSENIKNYCIGHWYGAFKLPATTVAVPENGPAPKLDKSNTLKDGYIIVTFEDVHSVKGNEPNEIKYLEVGPERYVQEGADTKFTLPNGTIGTILSNPNTGEGYIPAVIYETNIAMNQDAEVGGTH